MSQFYRFDEDEDKTPALRDEKPNKAPVTPTDKPAEKKKKKIQVWYALGALLTYYGFRASGMLTPENMHDTAAGMSVFEGCLYIGGLFVVLVLLFQNRDDDPWYMQLFGAALCTWLLLITIIFLVY